ncbi:hypothetical protein CAMGR0001_1025 [Campylobacter gracilis RM3268]|uniref:Uncharacterized protein n=1 Tax=Campylobacter gracilis RM3268 TaxID=553220 RepID=C8PGN0_9BACT|nr:hypothetical protein CAMGR0001_1025 [Campylobacter gracilis RM3268]
MEKANLKFIMWLDFGFKILRCKFYLDKTRRSSFNIKF